MKLTIGSIIGLLSLVGRLLNAKENTELKAGIIEQVSAFDDTAIPSFKPAPKKHRARVYMMRTGINGFTENEILRYCRLSSARNYAS